jgi:PAS domain S-box-containing protein
MMWLNNAECEHLRLMIIHSPSMYLVSSLYGGILWANPAFCEWSKYTLPELLRMSWKQLSAPDESLEADVVLAQTLDDYNVSYQVQKRYIPKNDRPQLGNLHVMRVPAQGQISYCFCRWEPLASGTAQAFELALESHKRIIAEMTELTKRVDAITSQTEEQKFTLSVVAMIAKHPKVALALVVVILSLGGFDTILSTLQRLGYVQPPPVIVKEVK